MCTQQLPTAQQVLKQMEEKMGAAPRPMVIMAGINPDAVVEHAMDQQFLGSQPNIPPKYKALINVAVAAALGSEHCTKNQIAMALKSGATKQEIVESLLCARLTKSSTIFSASAAGLELLAE
ncbi:MAG: carboxymuconolactone decarboxylase family protein [Actinobacteria bacterium]|nr:carboxymuconolactone decarboxylase family protein [Actinomycetota bacterium]